MNKALVFLLQFFRLGTFSLLLFFFSCGKNETLPPIQLYLDYYPLKLHSSIVYAVDSTHYNEFNHTTVNYLFELKDTVVSVLDEEEDRHTVRIERYKRESGGSWKFQKTITRTITSLRGEELIDNQRFVRLVFPPREGKTWNGNTYNNLGEQDYEILEADQPAVINGIALDSTVTIKQIDEINLIREDVVSEVYAKGIGLVQKDVRALDKDISSGIIRNGYVYSMTIKSFK